MAWVAVDMFGCERVYEQKPRRFANCVWVPTRCSYADRLNDFVTIPNAKITMARKEVILIGIVKLLLSALGKIS